MMPPDTHRLPPLVRLDSPTLLRVAGADAVSFLQGQVTCDVKALPEGRIVLGAACNPKGRAIAVFRLFRHADGCDLLARSDMLDTLRSRLQRYVLRAQVVLTDLREHWSVLGLPSAMDERVAEAVGLTGIPSAGHGKTMPGGGFVLAIDRSDKFLIAAPNDVAASLEAALIDDGLVRRCPPSEWQRAEIRDGVPVVTPATSEEFIPQMLNLDLLDGIGFSKGCYTGQEVVARTHYLGTVKRRMYRFGVSCGHPPEAGDRLVSEEDGNAVGDVLDAALIEDGRWELLAVAISDGIRRDALRLGSSTGPRIERMELAYLDAALARESSALEAL